MMEIHGNRHATDNCEQPHNTDTALNSRLLFVPAAAGDSGLNAPTACKRYTKHHSLWTASKSAHVHEQHAVVRFMVQQTNTHSISSKRPW